MISARPAAWSASTRVGEVAVTTPNPPPIPVSAMLGTLVVAIAAIVGVSVFYRNPDRVVPKQSTHGSRAESTLPVVAPPTNPLDKDGRLLFNLAAQGLRLSGPREVMISEAHQVCSRLARGESEQQVVQDILQGSPGMSVNTATTFADTAISVYCP